MAYKYQEVGVPENSGDTPKAWGIKPGAGQFEYQAFEDWTPDEKGQWTTGSLRSKWGIGQVSIRLPISGPLQFIAIVYGYLPFAIPIWWAVWALETYINNGKARFFPFFGLCIAAGFALVNEAVTKQICKRVLPEDITNRPPEAVCNHPGMPSGHVMNAYTLMVWCLLEVVLDRQMIHLEWVGIVCLVMLPVPWARVYNRDHTIQQVGASALVALFMGSAAYYIRKTYYPHHDQPWDWYNADASRGWNISSIPDSALPQFVPK